MSPWSIPFIVLVISILFPLFLSAPLFIFKLIEFEGFKKFIRFKDKELGSTRVWIKGWIEGESGISEYIELVAGILAKVHSFELVSRVCSCLALGSRVILGEGS